MARPSDYSEETTSQICNQMVQGRGLLQICTDEGMPDRVTVYRWLDKHEEFRNRYVRAREAMMDYYAEQILVVAFDESGDIVIEQDGNKSKAVANHAKVQRDRLKVDSLKWIASRLFPKRYGDKLAVEADTVDKNITVSWEKIERVIVDPRKEGFHAERQAQEPPRQLIYDPPVPPPADLTPEAECHRTRV